MISKIWSGKAGRILVIKAAGIGDLILAVPALRALRARFPEAVIDLLVTPKCVPLLERCLYVDHVFEIPTEGMQNRIVLSEIKPLFHLLRQLRSRQYDLAVNLYHLFSRRGAFRFRLLLQVVGAKFSVGRNTDGRGTFYDAAIDDSWEDPAFASRHEVDLNLDVVRLVGAEDPGEGLAFPVSDKDRSRVAGVLQAGEAGKRGSLRIVLNPGGDAVYKRWPAEYFASLADRLTERTGAEILIVGSEADRPVVERIISEMDHRPVDLAGKLSLPELAALFETCDLVVTNDTGPMHLAVAVGIPVVALFGPGKPGRYGPYGGEGFHHLLYHPVVCSPCTNFDCRDRDCLWSIRPEEVLKVVEETVAAGPRAAAAGEGPLVSLRGAEAALPHSNVVEFADRSARHGVA
ncbi:MAG: glycosyltransferase family 9 protein [Deltaproteobacteria bacterium]|nr:glycosyltransferase family 9 protein [Deltaproteobacteria bacterium]